MRLRLPVRPIDQMASYIFKKPSSFEKACKIQDSLRSKVICDDSFDCISTIAAVDCSHKSGEKNGFAGIIVYRYPELVELSRVVIEHEVVFPYIPGLLGFRELPLILSALESLSQMPDLFLVDGQGIAHPRRMGIASHLGVLLDLPAIGCAKSILVGKADMPQDKPGSFSYLYDKGQEIGALLRTKKGANPIVVSVGNRISLDTSLEIVLKCCDGARLPKPVREVDKLVNLQFKASVQK